jgi:hypothetical protein
VGRRCPSIGRVKADFYAANSKHVWRMQRSPAPHVADHTCRNGAIVFRKMPLHGPPSTPEIGFLTSDDTHTMYQRITNWLNEPDAITMDGLTFPLPNREQRLWRKLQAWHPAAKYMASVVLAALVSALCSSWPK